jgi:hypothetical protein
MDGVCLKLCHALKASLKQKPAATAAKIAHKSADQPRFVIRQRRICKSQPGIALSRIQREFREEAGSGAIFF